MLATTVYTTTQAALPAAVIALLVIGATVFRLGAAVADNQAHQEDQSREEGESTEATNSEEQ